MGSIPILAAEEKQIPAIATEGEIEDAGIFPGRTAVFSGKKSLYGVRLNCCVHVRVGEVRIDGHVRYQVRA